jgi:hypothetical protein
MQNQDLQLCIHRPLVVFVFHKKLKIEINLIFKNKRSIDSRRNSKLTILCQGNHEMLTLLLECKQTNDKQSHNFDCLHFDLFLLSFF